MKYVVTTRAEAQGQVAHNTASAFILPPTSFRLYYRHFTTYFNANP